MIRKLVQARIKKSGYTYFHKSVQPKGIDLVTDLERLEGKSLVNWIIFDVGANVGDFTDYLLGKTSNCEFKTFEPIKDTFSKLQNRFKANSKVMNFNFALGEKAGDQVIHLFEDNQLNSLKGDLSSDEQISNKQTVIIKTLSDFCPESSVERIDLLKIDTEGFELEILRGGIDILKNVKYIFVEVGFVDEDLRHTSFVKVDKFLKELGFSFYSLYDLYHYNRPYELLFANALFVNKSFFG